MSIFSLFKRKRVYEFNSHSSYTSSAIDEFLSCREKLESLHGGRVHLISVDNYGVIKYLVASDVPPK